MQTRCAATVNGKKTRTVKRYSDKNVGNFQFSTLQTNTKVQKQPHMQGSK